MPMTDEAPQDDLTADELRLLKRAGASEPFITVAQRSAISLGETRNLARNKAINYLRGEYGPRLTEETADDFEPNAGHFLTRLWDGNLYKAMRRADIQNSRILREVFGLERINADAPMGARPYTIEEGRVVRDPDADPVTA